jgi:hypothetical protein
MVEITLEKGRTYGVLFEVRPGDAEVVRIQGVDADAALLARPDGTQQTLALTDGTMQISPDVTAQTGYVQVRIEDGYETVFGFRVARERMGAQAADSAQLGGKAPGYYLSPRSLLDNGDFTRPVNQRGQLSYTGAGRTIDRWKATNANAQVTVNAGASVTFGAGSGGDAFFRQFLESYTSQALRASSPQGVYTSQSAALTAPLEGSLLGDGGTATLALCLADGTVKAASGNVPVSAPTADTPIITIFFDAQIGHVQLRIDPEGALYIQMRANAGNSFALRWIALYEGTYTADTLPPYVPRDYAAELAACRRYYVQIPAYATAFAGYVPADGNRASAVLMGPSMRVNPTQTRSPGYLVAGGQVVNATLTDLTAIDGMVIANITAQGAPANQACVFYTDAVLGLDADL